MSLIDLIKISYPIILGGFLAYIAYQQHITNRSKLKLDLYSKRFDIYKDTLKFYQELIGGELSKDTHLRFIVSKEASYHLFSENRDIYKLLDEIHAESFKVTAIEGLGSALDGAPERKNEMHQNSLSVLSWLSKAMPELREKMSKYLDQKIT